MCPPAAMAALAVAQSVASFAAASADYNAKADQWRQNYSLSLQAGVEDQKRLLLRAVQEQDAFAQKAQETNIQGAKIKAEAEASAGQSGVGGISVDNIMAGIDRDVARNVEADRTNYMNTAEQITAELTGTNSTIQNRINSVQRPVSPSPIGFALQGIGGAIKAFN